MQRLAEPLVDLMCWLIEFEGEYGFYYSDLDEDNPTAIFVDGEDTYLLSGKKFNGGYLFEL